MITGLLTFLWGLFLAALKFAFVIFRIIARIVLVLLAVLLAAIYFWRRKRT